jgi:hypothetical protein
MNAVSHALTARIALLSDESPDEYQERKNGWVNELKPRDQVELVMAERAFYHSWQLKRVMRAEWARLSFRAHTKRQDDQNRVEQNVAELGLRLFQRLNGGQDAIVAGADGAGREAKVGCFDPADHPARVVGRLEATGAGCQWLIDRFRELEAILESDQVWYAPERFRAFRLLRIHPGDAYYDTALTLLVQACQVLDPEAGSLVGEVWNEFVPTDKLPELEETYQRAIRHRPAPDHAAAREQLLKIVRGEIERLAEKALWHEERAEIEAALSDHLLAFDDSKEAELLRRYEFSCEKLMHRNLDELKKRHCEKADRGENRNYGFGGAAPRFGGRVDAGLFETVRRMSPPPSHRSADGSPEGSASRDEASGTGAPAETREPGLRNEPNEVERGEEGLRNEPNRVGLLDSQSEVGEGVAPNGKQDVGTAEPQGALSQPAPATFGGHRRDLGHGSALKGSRHQRKRRERNRRNAERAAAKAQAEGKRK